MDDRASALRGRRALVTGGTGFVGRHLVRELTAAGAEAHVLTRREPHEAATPTDHQRHVGDLRDRRSLERVVSAVRPEIVFHLGGYTEVAGSWSNMADCVEVNVVGTAHLLEALAPHPCERFVHVSTSEVYGDGVVPFLESSELRPRSPYAVSKRAAEMLCELAAESCGWAIVQLRLFSAYGPGQPTTRLIPEIITKALAGSELKMTRGTQTRDFTYVLDLVEGIVLAAAIEGLERETINLGSGEEVAIQTMATDILELLGHPIVAQLGALPDRPSEVERVVADRAKARALLGWSPTVPRRQGLADTIAWYRQHTAHPGDG